jgi:hypothetical protein
MIRNSSDLLVALIGNGIRTIITTRSTSSDACRLGLARIGDL